jgi:hypothetical protein
VVRVWDVKEEKIGLYWAVMGPLDVSVRASDDIKGTAPRAIGNYQML